MYLKVSPDISVRDPLKEEVAGGSGAAEGIVTDGNDTEQTIDNEGESGTASQEDSEPQTPTASRRSTRTRSCRQEDSSEKDKVLTHQGQH